ncbi:MAG: hypothetical protein A2189_09490 [Paenibacillus sp. RIFOXYA1_FULL_44_5]|nr:MAG: hypothetical protein A2189_09490 [Paenibacillus sp. RIFOXYA1_FULL_44_5]
MRTIAIITDIHGNRPALQSVWDDLDTRGVDHIYCLGDLVAIGPDSNEILEMITARSSITTIAGNHEQAVLAAYDGIAPPKGHHQERKHHEWIASRLNPLYVPFLRELPPKWEEVIEGHSFLFTHYHMDGQQELLPIDKNPSAEKLDQIYQGIHVDAVCFGHHHVIHHFHSASIYINPGSLGCNSHPLARYAVLQISEAGIEVEYLAIPYERQEFIESYEALQLPDWNFILKAFHGVER